MEASSKEDWHQTEFGLAYNRQTSLSALKAMRLFNFYGAVQVVRAAGNILSARTGSPVIVRHYILGALRPSLGDLLELTEKDLVEVGVSESVVENVQQWLLDNSWPQLDEG